MKTLICFDIDGVFKQKEELSQYVNGPIDPEWVKDLNSNGDLITLVSPSPFYPKDDKGFPLWPVFAEFESNDYRHRNLLNSIEYCKQFFNPILKLYVSDNGDYKEAQKAGFVYVDSQMFANAWETSPGERK